MFVSKAIAGPIRGCTGFRLFGFLAFSLNIHPIILILAGAVSGALLGLGGKKL